MLQSSLPYTLILGSQSPRRQELLKALDIPFEIKVPFVDEVYPMDMTPVEIPVYLANLKLDHLLQTANTSDLILCSDTIVDLDGKILEKPKDKAEAISMLSQLAGNVHKVHTGVAIGSTEKRSLFVDTTEVTFASLATPEIEYYIEHYHPFDKAGSYGVQDWIGMIAIKSITGSFYTVMGLPVHMVYEELKKWCTND